MGKKQIQEIPNVMLSVREAAIAITVSTKMIRKLICSGRIKSINLGMRLTRITLDELLKLAEESGYQIIMPNNEAIAKPKPETGKVNKTAKYRKTPAHEKAPEGVTHDTHYTMAEILSKFGIKYGRLYEIRNRYLLKFVHAWGTTCFDKTEVDNAIAQYEEEQGRAQSETYYTCFDIMQKFGLGKT